ncbi:MAG: hypothetical protein GC151_06850 [Betaproteobacteria bacterium]|nr:hypothetical protein [Betaproteobacteria bacterium]
MKRLAAAIAAASVLAATCASADESVESRLETLTKEIEQLKAQVGKSQGAREDSGKSGSYGEFQSAAERAETEQTAIGGYGEFNYNNYRDGTVRDRADLRRFVLFFGHKFSERLRLYSELEVEHAFVEGNEASGEVAMEQAFLQYQLAEWANLRAGLMLIPSGILNEYHEPPTFYGVERNEVETRIIPSTWRELGFALQGHVLDGLEYNTGLVTSPDASHFTNASAGFRSMRTAGGQATANDFAYYLALNYRGVPGLLVGGSVYTGNTAHDGQGTGANAVALAGVSARLTLWEAHTRFSAGGFDLRALYAKGSLGDTAAINSAAGLAAGSNSAAPESFYGWYVEAAYHAYKKGDLDVAPFVRYARYDTQESVAPGFTIDPLNNEKVTTVGLSFKVHPQVVFKVDYQNFRTDDKKDRVNVGVGYMF